MRRVFGPAALFLVLLAACRAESPAPTRPNPNILLITVDTLRPDALGWIGGKSATPAIDALAGEGFRFPAAVSHVPLTFPSHASILTGVLPRRMGLRDNGQTLGTEPPMLQELLRARGYTTAAFVSGYPLARQFGLDRGFDHYDDRFDAGDGETLERAATATTAAARTWLSTARAPWFVWIHYYDPHYPYDGSYAAEVERVDRAVGDLLGHAGDALTVFAADHGESLGEHGEGTHGFFIYDATMLVPLVIRWRGVVPPGESGAAVRLIDVAPTILDLIGAAAPERIDGMSVVPTLRGETQTIPPAYIETYQPWTSYGWAPLSGMRDGAEKYIAAPKPELYDLKRDPKELANIYETDRARRLAVAHRKARQLPPLASAESAADSEAIAKLRSLGYLGGGASNSEPPSSGLRDPKDARDLRDLLTEGDLRLRAGDAAGAVKKFDAVLTRDPQNRFAILRSAIALMSVPRLEKAVALMPDQPEARSALARALLRDGRAADAIPHAMEAARLQPRSSAAWGLLGTALGRERRVAEAVEALKRAVELEPGDAKLLARLAFAEHAAGKIDDATLHLQRVAELEGEAFTHSAALAILFDMRGRREEARQWLARARPTEPEYDEAQRRLSQ